MVKYANVEVELPPVVEAMAKSTVGLPTPVVDVARMASCAYGVDVPRPKLPVEESKEKMEPFGLPKRMVEEAERPPARRRSVEVEFAFVPKDVVGVNGKIEESEELEILLLKSDQSVEER